MNRDIDLNKLRVFLHVVDQDGVSAAARHLNVTRSAVSQSVSTLETALGVPLFDRVGKRLVLTREGRLLYEHFGAQQADLEQTLCALSNPEAAPAGPVRIGVFPGFARMQLADLLSDFATGYPETNSRVVYAPQRDLDQRLLTSRIDFVFSLRARESASPRITSTRLFRQELVLVGSRRLLGDGADVSLLGQVPVIDYYQSDPLIDRWIDHHLEPGRLSGRPDVRAWAATTDLVLELLLRRAGVGVLPRAVAAPFLKARRLVLLETDRPPLTDYIWLNEVESEYRSPVLRAFHGAVLERFAHEDSSA